MMAYLMEKMEYLVIFMFDFLKILAIMEVNKIHLETENDYMTLMVQIDALMKKGESNLNDKEANHLRNMALAAQAYEKKFY